MKKFILIFVISFITVSFASAQSQLYFGLGGSFLSTWTTNQNNHPYADMDYAPRMGFGGNVTIGFDFNSSLGLKTEIGWASLGQNYKDVLYDTNNVRRDISLNYLQIPLLFKYRGGSEKVKFFVAAGPQFNFLMNGKQNLVTDYALPNDSVTTISGKTFYYSQEDITEKYMSMDIMARVDIGAEIYFTPNLFLDAGLTFGYGLTDVNAEDYRFPDSDGNYDPSHNLYGGIQVGIHYALPVGKK